jgi:O-methyltransferase involved in polyketide biosynthesis
MTSFDSLPTVDMDHPSAARAYDYFLGGSSNFAIDREFAEQVKRIAPSIPSVTLLNRSFLRRVVNFYLSQGIRQFLDLGSGIPTVGNVHQITQAAAPDTCTVYVDNEAVAYNHAHRMLADNPNATILHADMREVDVVLNHEDTQRLLDFSQPIGLLVVGVLLYLPDSDDPGGMIRTYRERLVPGSFVAVSTLTDEHADDALRAEMDGLRAAYEQAGQPVYPRTHAEISAWFDGMEMIEPGLVTLPEWHGDGPDELLSVARPLGYGGVARVG